MKAIRIHNYGGPEVLRYEDAPRPRVKNGEVLIRVHAAGVNPLDWKYRNSARIERQILAGARPGAIILGL